MEGREGTLSFQTRKGGGRVQGVDHILTPKLNEVLRHPAHLPPLLLDVLHLLPGQALLRLDLAAEDNMTAHQHDLLHRVLLRELYVAEAALLLLNVDHVAKQYCFRSESVISSLGR